MFVLKLKFKNVHSIRTTESFKTFAPIRTTESLKSFTSIRATELAPSDTSSKEAVSRLYCSINKDLLFRKKAWLERMEKELPQSLYTHELRCNVLQVMTERDREWDGRVRESRLVEGERERERESDRERVRVKKRGWIERDRERERGGREGGRKGVRECVL